MSSIFMRFFRSLFLVSFIPLCVLCTKVHANTILIETQNFTSLSGWTKENFRGQLSIGSTANSNVIAQTNVVLPEDTTYYIWVNIYEFEVATQQYPRHIELSINSQPLAIKGYGEFGGDKWRWMRLGVKNLSSLTSLSIKALSVYCHVSAVLLTTDENFDPNKNVTTESERKSYYPKYNSYLLEAEKFSDTQGWSVVNRAQTPTNYLENQGYLENLSSGASKPSVKFNVSAAGYYYIWVSSYEFNDALDRSYKILLNNETIANTAYSANKAENWVWKNLGIVHLKKGENIIQLDANLNQAICDAIFITENPYESPAISDNMAWRSSKEFTYESIFLEAENFANKMQWQVSNYRGEGVLFSELIAENTKASTKFNANGGVYYIWTSSYEFNLAEELSPRHYEVYLNGTKLEKNGYASLHTSSWVWSLTAVASLPQGVSEVAIKAKSEFCRVDAIFLTQDPNFNPNQFFTTVDSRVSKTQSYNTYTLDAKNFTNKGSWTLASSYSQQCLNKTTYSAGSAMPSISVSIANGGDYFVWANVYEFNLDAQGSPRTVDVLINGVKTKRCAYRQLGGNAWIWSNLDKVFLPTGTTTIQLNALTANVRFLSLTLTTDPNYDPNKSDNRNSTALPSETFLIESEEFQFYGSWTKDTFGGATGIMTVGATSCPMTRILLRSSGKYYIWASSNDFAYDRPGSRTYKVSFDKLEMPNLAGKHGKEGVYWEKLGYVWATSGEHVLELIRNTSYCRSDAILLTQDENFNPNEMSQTKASLKRKVDNMEFDYISNFPTNFETFVTPSSQIVSIDNGLVKIEYISATSLIGEVLWKRRVSLFKDNVWNVGEILNDETLFLIYAANATRTETPYFSTWPASVSKVKIDGVIMDYKLSDTDPYSAAPTEILKPLSATKIDNNTLEITYSNSAKSRIVLKENSLTAKMSTSLPIAKAGYYSVGFLGFNKIAKSDMKAIEMPSMFQGTRLMDTPKQVTNNFMSQPMALMQTLYNSKNIINGVVADPVKLGTEWTTALNSVYGFSNLNPDSINAHTVIFSPVFAGKDSLKAQGDTLEISWYLLTEYGDWKRGVELANQEIFETMFTREPYDVSFSDAVCNLAEYLKAKSANGWCDKNKGRYNIEGVNVSTHASPLSEVSVALLTNDEDYYKNISLQTIEYTLSRYSSHFAFGTIEEKLDNFGDTTYQLSVPSKLWTGDYYAGLNKLLGNRNEWLRNYYYKTDNTVFNRSAGSNLPEWACLLGLYYADPSEALLSKVKAACDAWLPTAEYTGNAEINMELFVNVSSYMYWWYLVDLYELTGEKKYLDAAENGAFYTLSCLWSYPKSPEGDVAVHKNNLVIGVSRIWWKGYGTFRLGYEENRQLIKDYFHLNDSQLSAYASQFFIPEKTVPIRKVSRIGLGIEQHSTYPAGASQSRNIFMPSWAPELLKVYQHTGREIIHKFSRHAILGRFANFFGYYIQDFTDIHQRYDYPYAGPDISSFYYHHAPCQFGQSFDYLMSQLEHRTNNKIRFPFVRQQGYVWFTDRIFGQRGKVFNDENCRLILDKIAVRPETPRISVMLARAKDALWVFLLNDSVSNVAENISFNFASKAFKGVKQGNSLGVYDASGALLNTSTAGSSLNIEIPALGFKALRIIAEFEDVQALPPLTTSDFQGKFANVEASLGNLHYFRIRGPFGKDSFFAIFDGKGRIAQNATLFLKTKSGLKVINSDSFPYEFSYYGIDYDEPELQFGILVQESGKADIVINPQNIVDPAWLKSNIPNPSDYDKVLNSDLDNDGFTGFEEYQMGTDPSNCASKFSFAVAQQTSGGAVTISFDGVAGRTYTIKWSDDLKVWKAFIQNGTKNVLSNGVQEFIDDYTSATSGIAPAESRRFYKIEVSK